MSGTTYGPNVYPLPGRVVAANDADGYTRLAKYERQEPLQILALYTFDRLMLCGIGDVRDWRYALEHETGGFEEMRAISDLADIAAACGAPAIAGLFTTEAVRNEILREVAQELERRGLRGQAEQVIAFTAGEELAKTWRA